MCVCVCVYKVQIRYHQRTKEEEERLKSALNPVLLKNMRIDCEKKNLVR